MDGDDDLPYESERTIQCIRDASRIVRPNELLRTKILERARQHERDARSDRRVLKAVVAVVLCSILLVFAGSRIDAWREDHLHRLTWEGMQERATEIAAGRKSTADASLFEAIVEWRLELAQRWRNPAADPPVQP